jgi:hypothetical protein
VRGCRVVESRSEGLGGRCERSVLQCLILLLLLLVMVVSKASCCCVQVVVWGQDAVTFGGKGLLEGRRFDKQRVSRRGGRVEREEHLLLGSYRSR